MTSKEIDKILVEYLFGLTLSSGQALDPNDSVGSSVRAETVKDLLALIQQETQETELYGLEKERKLLLDINRGYTSNPTNQSFYIKKAIIVDRHIAKLKGETK